MFSIVRRATHLSKLTKPINPLLMSKKQSNSPATSKRSKSTNKSEDAPAKLSEQTQSTTQSNVGNVNGIVLSKVVSILEGVAPLKLAESWDNVGLLVGPTEKKTISKMLLTNDLTDSVMKEAVESKTDFILSYHPPIFAPLKRLTPKEPKEKLILTAIENRIAIYSPHTALDSVNGGITDWLASGLGELSKSQVLTPHASLESENALKVVVFIPSDRVDNLRTALAAVGAGVVGNYTECTFGVDGTGSFVGNENSNPSVGSKGKLEQVKETRLEFYCAKNKLSDVVSTIRKNHPYETPTYDVYSLTALPASGTGQGRIVTLKEPTPMGVLLQRVKKHLGMNQVLVGLGNGVTMETNVKTIAICPGAGGEVIGRVNADVLWTGEMRHHEVLGANSFGRSVILCQHSNTERGFLPVLAERLRKLFEDNVVVSVSSTDKDPLSIM